MAGSISGTVHNQRDSQPIAGASLKLTGEGVDNTGSSGNDGSFSFANLAEGSYDLLVKQAGFDDGNYGPLVVINDVDTQIQLALQPSDV